MKRIISQKESIGREIRDDLCDTNQPGVGWKLRCMTYVDTKGPVGMESMYSIQIRYIKVVITETSNG